MDIRDIKAAKDHAELFGCKCIVYGPAGTGKTPLINTAPRPLLLSMEPGLLSMRNSSVPTYLAHDTNKVDDFFKWFFNSNETKVFDTLAIDSGSYMADMYLQAALSGKSQAGNKKHGQAAYGDMATNTMAHIRTLFYTKYKHVYLICKEQVSEVNYQQLAKPYFPGNVLNVDVPFLYDFILRLAKVPINGGEHLAFQCEGNMNVLSRNRTGNLDIFEPPHFGALVQKAMSAPPLIQY